MPGTDDPQQQPPPEHEPIVPLQPEISQELSRSLDVPVQEKLESSDVNSEKAVGVTAEATTTASPLDAKQDGTHCETSNPSQSSVDPTIEHADHGAMTREIERRASEHMAKRAAEMSLDESARGQGESAIDMSRKEEEALPQTPPPPIPPRKDSAPPKPSAIQTDFDEKNPPLPPHNEETQNDVPEPPLGVPEATGAEIQNIMGQFEDGMGGMPETEIMSPRLQRQQSILVLPPRSSSLEPQPEYAINPISRQSTGQSIASPLTAQGTGNSVSASSVSRVKSEDQSSITSSRPMSLYKPPPPSPDPEPALPFDFHRFLEQLRHRTADPVARFLRSFLSEFGKRQWMVHEQVKIISDFLEFITKKMAQCEVWRTVSDAEFDNAREGMEKLVMNRLYSQTFSPAIPAAIGTPRKSGRNGRSQADQASPYGQGRRGQHQEDVERDDVIAQKLRIYGWIREEHLDIKPIGDKGKKFLGLAQQELLKINTYRAPRDKVICVLNCCKVIFGFLRNSKADQSADAFVPLLIYTVLQARPGHLVSNVQYIWRFRNQDKLGGEAGYYMSSLMGVVSFIENLDRTTLTISDEEFERNVEHAVSAIAEKNRSEEYEDKAHSAQGAGPMQHLSEKSTLSRAEVTPRNSEDAEHSTPKKNISQRLTEKAPINPSTDDDRDADGVTGLLRSIQKPLSGIGRLFTDDGHEKPNPSRSGSSALLPTSTPRGLSPAPNLERRRSDSRRPATERQISQQRQAAAEDAMARQASVESAHAQKTRAREYRVVVETLQSMFPNLDKEVIEDVVRAQEGHVGRAVDACLALSSGGG